jgi:hypothetical protein
MSIKSYRDKRFCDVCGKQIVTCDYYTFKKIRGNYSMGHFVNYFSPSKEDMCESCMEKFKKWLSKKIIISNWFYVMNSLIYLLAGYFIGRLR